MLLREPWADLLDSLRHHVVYPPGFFFLFRFTSGSELGVRLTCLALGIASLWVFDRLAHATLDPAPARLASLFFVLSPMAIELSTEAKMYGAELFGLLLALLAFRRGRPFLAAAALALAISCHPLAAFAGLALAVTALGLAPRERAVALGALALAAAVHVPWYVSLAPVAHGPGSHVDVPAVLSRAALRPEPLAEILVGLVSHNFPAIPGLGLRTVSAFALALLALAWMRVRSIPGTLWLLLPGLMIPYLLAAAIAPSYPGYGNVAKYALAALPPLLLALGAACSGRRALTLALIALNALSLTHTFTTVSGRELWHVAAAAIPPDGPVVVWPPTALMPLCAASPGFGPDSARVHLLPVLPYGRPVTRSPKNDIFQSLSWSLDLDAEREVASLTLKPPFTVVLGRPLPASATARAIIESLSRRHGPPRPLLEHQRIPVVYQF